jgi:hypothetical protein
MHNLFSQDAMQANLGFVVSQTSHVEAQVYSIKYPDIQYPALIPVDTSANPYATSVTYYSMDKAGKAEWVSGKAKDIPTVGLSMEKFETPVYMGGIGYDWGIEEVGQAAMLGINLGAEKASAARRAYEEFVDRIALFGDDAKGFSGLFDYPGIDSQAVESDGSGSSTTWATKTGDQILRDVNDMISGIYTSTLTTEIADTLIMPFARYNSIATKRLGDTNLTILEFLRQNNVYTATTGQPLVIRGVRGLEEIGAGSSARMVAYRRSPEVLKLHIPMPHQFLPVQVMGLSYEVPGVFRLGGLDVRLPGAVRYRDGI